MALTDELIGQNYITGRCRFLRGGSIYISTSLATSKQKLAYPRLFFSARSTWPLLGDIIPISDTNGGVLVPTVLTNGSIALNVLHAYLSSTVPGTSSSTVQYWTLPLAWVGQAVSSVTITPDGEVKNQIQILIDDRNLTLIGMVPGWPVRLFVL